MAATPKPVRKELKKVAGFTRKHSNETHHKAEIQSKAKKMKESGKKKSEVNMMKEMHRKPSKRDLEKAHSHMKKHGG